MRPLSSLNNRSARTLWEVRVRPLPSSGLEKFGKWIQEQDWINVLASEFVDTKAEKLHNMILDKLEEVCPEKTRKISSDDQPFFSEQLKRLHRKKRREYNKNRKSAKYLRLKKIFKHKVALEKIKFKKKMIDDVMSCRYSKLKRITNNDQEKSNLVQVE